MSWTTITNILVVNGHNVASFPFPIRLAKEIQGTIIVILDITPNEIFSRNAYGYVLSESRLWQIDKYYPQEPLSGVVVIDILPNDNIIGQVILWTWTCIVLYVDIKTGKVIRTEISK